MWCVHRGRLYFSVALAHLHIEAYCIFLLHSLTWVCGCLANFNSVCSGGRAPGSLLCVASWHQESEGVTRFLDPSRERSSSRLHADLLNIDSGGVGVTFVK